jgi:hypothetical protein
VQQDDVLLGKSQADVRRIDWRTRVSFEKQFDGDISLFVLDTSTLDGDDFLGGTGSVVQEWDKYGYEDVSDRTVAFSWEREEDHPSSLSLAMADLTLNNYDGLYDPDGTSRLSEFMLPFRPVRLQAGFDGSVVPVFIGLSEKMPVVDDNSKTVSFHCIDFLSSLLSNNLDETVLYTNMRTDEIIGALLEANDLLPEQYVFDVGLVTIPFFYAEKGAKLFGKIRPLVEAEMGRLYMDELGMIRFKNRNNVDNDVKFSFNTTEHIIQATKRREIDMINVVEVRSNVRAVQPNQKIWESVETTEIGAGQLLTVWADFNDPVTSVDAPAAGGATSFWLANSASDGSGSDVSSSLSLTVDDLFSTSYKMVFRNTSASTVYLTSVVLFGTPALVIKEIYVRETDAPSVEKYGEQIYSVENDYYTSEDDAQTYALNILAEYGLYSGVSEIEVKGTPQFQLGDLVSVNLFDRIQLCRIIKIVCEMSDGRFVQRLRLKQFVERSYFTLDESTLDSSDELGV